MPADPLTWQRDGFEVTTDPARLDLDAIHAFLSGVSWALVTRDAHALYSAYGFRPVARPERWMEITNPDPYRKARSESGE